MKCSLCDTANADSANFCFECGTPLVARECRACGAVFDKSANQCPACGEAVPVAVDSMHPLTNRSVATQLSAAVAPSTLTLSSEAHLMARLVNLLEQIEGELAARRAASASLEEASPVLLAGLPARVERTAPTKPKRAPWLVAAGLVVAAAGMLLYRPDDQGFLEQFHRQAPTSPASVPPSGPAAATDPVAVPPVPTPAAATVAARSEPASAPATQAATEDQADAEPPDAVLSTIEHDPPVAEAAPEAPAPSAEPVSTTTAPEARNPVDSGQNAQSRAARPERAAAPEKAVDAEPAAAREVAAAPAPGPKPPDDLHCRENAVSAMGLCEKIWQEQEVR